MGLVLPWCLGVTGGMLRVELLVAVSLALFLDCGVEELVVRWQALPVTSLVKHMQITKTENRLSV